jgi:dTDP-4-dehydrorhamnose reductase
MATVGMIRQALARSTYPATLVDSDGMRALVLGSTGMVGQAIMQEAGRRGISTTGVARSGADIEVDVRELPSLVDAVERVKPDIIVNSVAVVDLTACEEDPCLAYRVNARPLAVVADLAAALGAKLVHISTDHYFTGDGRSVHDESAPVRLLNEYARSKLAGERFALTNQDALVIRTNVTGFRNHKAPTFAEWIFQALESGEPVTAFDDFFCSTMSTGDLAGAVFDLVDENACGLLNVASSEVSSKKEFIEAIAAEMGAPDPPMKIGTVHSLDPPRAESSGLNVAKAESLLGRSLPDLRLTASRLAGQRSASSAPRRSA